LERRGRAERRGAADLEKHVAGLSAVDQRNGSPAGRGQRASDVDDEKGIGIAQRVKREAARQLNRRTKAVDSRRQRKAAQVLP
jgi:hypothetical protein